MFAVPYKSAPTSSLSRLSDSIASMLQPPIPVPELQTPSKCWIGYVRVKGGSCVWSEKADVASGMSSEAAKANSRRIWRTCGDKSGCPFVLRTAVSHKASERWK